MRAFEISKSTPVIHLLQQGHPSYSFLNNFTSWEPNNQIYEPTGTILIQTATPWLLDGTAHDCNSRISEVDAVHEVKNSLGYIAGLVQK